MTPQLINVGDIVETATLALEDYPALSVGYVTENWHDGVVVRMLWRTPGAKRNLKDTELDVVLPYSGVQRLIGAFDAKTNRVRYFKGEG